MFHHFHGQGHYQSQGSMSANELRALIQHLGVDNILSPHSWIEYANRGQLHSNHYCLTFDDNLQCQYDVARPVLDEFGIKAFWFVTTQPLVGEISRLEVYRYFRHVYFDNMSDFYQAFVDEVMQSGFRSTVKAHHPSFEASNYLKEFTFYDDLDRWFRYIRDEILSEATYDEIMQSMMQKTDIDVEQLNEQLHIDGQHLKHLHDMGHIIGLHSHTHPTQMHKLSKQQQQVEYETCTKILNDILGEPPIAMSHPCGSFNDDTFDILDRLNVKIGFHGIMLSDNLAPYAFMRREHNYVMEEIES